MRMLLQNDGSGIVDFAEPEPRGEVEKEVRKRCFLLLSDLLALVMHSYLTCGFCELVTSSATRSPVPA